MLDVKKNNESLLSKEERIRIWHEAGVLARKKNKEKRDAKRKWLLEHPDEAEDVSLKKKIKHKRRGRPKKRGPKRKRKYISKKIKVKNNVKFDYKIVGVLNGKQNEYIDKFSTLEDAYECFRNLKAANDNIVFKRKVINAGVLKESRDEYLLLQKNRTGDLTNGFLRNQYGKLVEQISNNPKWIIYDKCERNVEETFWVYGKCPKTDRKTFQWIYDNIIIGKIINSYDIERILLYKNKLIVKHDDGMDIIICKNIPDSIRFYEMLKEWCKKNHNVFFMGDYSQISDKRRELENEIIEYTGWSKVKLQRDSTRA